VAPPYPHEFGPPSAEARAESRRREFSFINARQGNADGGGFGDGDVLVFRSRRRDGVDADAGRFDAALGKVRSELKTWRKPIGVCVVDHVFGPAADGADFLVEATWDSPDGRATLPYLAKQIPVITTKYNGAAELIDDRVNGFVIDSPDDVESLADRMLRLCDSVTRFRFRSNLREVSQYLRIERYVDDLLALYEDILRRKRGGGDSGDPPAGGTGFAV
jgi:glycosyltransferase involved in cell wall biosynthesis